METVNVTVRMERQTRDDAAKLFSELGLTMNAAFNMFVKQSIREQSIPFKITRNTNVQYMDRSLLDRMLEESEKKHHKVYEELAK